MKIVTMRILEMSHQYADLCFTMRVNASRATTMECLRFGFCVWIFISVKISLKKLVHFGQKF